MSVQPLNMKTLAHAIKDWGLALGFSGVGITDINLSEAEPRLLDWIKQGFHGQMHYFELHGLKRVRPAELVPGAYRIISTRMNYAPAGSWLADAWDTLQDSQRAYIARYALGRDYHKVMRRQLQALAGKIAEEIGPFGYRVFSDSAPVMEVELAKKAGLGWRGKHTLLLSREQGSLFFLGEIFTDLPLPMDAPTTDHCGVCQACISICPTQAIIAPYKLDARRCIAYLTIELKGSIPIEFRPLIGNRVYGCDDCQLVCPWNKYAKAASNPDFRVRQGLDRTDLCTLFGWTEKEFNERLAGSPIRRIGYVHWLRNLAVGLGNAPKTPAVLGALAARREDASELVREHVAWALQQK